MKKEFEEPQVVALQNRLDGGHHLLIQGTLKRNGLRPALVIPAWRCLWERVLEEKAKAKLGYEPVREKICEGERIPGGGGICEGGA